MPDNVILIGKQVPWNCWQPLQWQGTIPKDGTSFFRKQPSNLSWFRRECASEQGTSYLQLMQRAFAVAFGSDPSDVIGLITTPETYQRETEVEVWSIFHPTAQVLFPALCGIWTVENGRLKLVVSPDHVQATLTPPSLSSLQSIGKKGGTTRRRKF